MFSRLFTPHGGGHDFVVSAYRGVGAAVGITLGAQLVVKELLLCALGKVTQAKSGAIAKAQHAADSNEWAFIKVPQGYASPSKNSMKAPATPEPCTPRFRSSRETCCACMPVLLPVSLLRIQKLTAEHDDVSGHGHWPSASAG